MRTLGGFIAMFCAAAIVMVAPPVAEATSHPPEAICEVLTTPDGFDVLWTPAADSSADTVKYVVERQMFSRYWWRGAVTDGALVFSDQTAPRSAARVQYRIVAVAASGAPLFEIPCSPKNTPGFTCVKSVGSDGRDALTWNAPEGLTSLDYVVRRKVTDHGEHYWRGRTDDLEFSDAPLPTGSAEYLVIARTNRVIAATTTCSDGNPGSGGGGEPGCATEQSLPVSISDFNVVFDSTTSVLHSTTAAGEVISHDTTSNISNVSLPEPGAANAVVVGVTPAGGTYVQRSGSFYFWDGRQASAVKSINSPPSQGTAAVSPATGNLFMSTAEGLSVYLVDSDEVVDVSEGAVPIDGPLGFSGVDPVENGVVYFQKTALIAQPDTLYRVQESPLALEAIDVPGLEFPQIIDSQGDLLLVDGLIDETGFLGFAQVNIATGVVTTIRSNDGAYFFDHLTYGPDGQVFWVRSDRSFAALEVWNPATAATTTIAVANDQNGLGLPVLHGFTNNGEIIYSQGASYFVFDVQSGDRQSVDGFGVVVGGSAEQLITLDSPESRVVRLIDRSCLAGD